MSRLIINDDKLLEHAKKNPQNVKATHATIVYGIIVLSSSTTMRMAMMMGIATLASAAELNAHDTGSDGKYMGIFLPYTSTFIVVIAPVLVEKYVFQRPFVRKMALYTTCARRSPSRSRWK